MLSLKWEIQSAFPSKSCAFRSLESYSQVGRMKYRQRAVLSFLHTQKEYWLFIHFNFFILNGIIDLNQLLTHKTLIRWFLCKWFTFFKKEKAWNIVLGSFISVFWCPDVLLHSEMETFSLSYAQSIFYRKQAITEHKFPFQCVWFVLL